MERIAYKPLEERFLFSGSTDHSDRCQLSAAECGTSDLWSECEDISFSDQMERHFCLQEEKLKISGETIVTIVVCVVIMVVLMAFVQ